MFLVTWAPSACRDHAGGNDKIKQLCPGIVVIGTEIAPAEQCQYLMGAPFKARKLHLQSSACT